MTRNLIQFEREACTLKAEMEDLAALIAALIGETVAVQVRAAEAILLTGKLADGLADAIEGGGSSKSVLSEDVGDCGSRPENLR